jgi:hypothetical protein
MVPADHPFVVPITFFWTKLDVLSINVDDVYKQTN